jgi:Tfp pilus assembly protein PilN
MTTTLTQPDPVASAERALRILPIAANLLPEEIVEARRSRHVRRIVLTALIALVAVLAAWNALASYQTSTARSGLSNVEDDAQRLMRQQRAFGEVVSIQAEAQLISTRLSSLLADDLRWSRLLSGLQTAAPRGVQVTGVSGALTAGTSGHASGVGGHASGSVTQLPGTSGEEPIGTLTVTGSGPSKEVVAAYVDALAKVPGLDNPLLGSAYQDNGVLQFSVQLDITGSAVGGRYTSKSSNGPGEH